MGRRHHSDVEHYLQPDRAGEPIRVRRHPWSPSDNGSVFIFYDLRDYLKGYHIDHVRGFVDYYNH
jgi:hypothetical protein